MLWIQGWAQVVHCLGLTLCLMLCARHVAGAVEWLMATGAAASWLFLVYTWFLKGPDGGEQVPWAVGHVAACVLLVCAWAGLCRYQDARRVRAMQPWTAADLRRRRRAVVGLAMAAQGAGALAALAGWALGSGPWVGLVMAAWVPFVLKGHRAILREGVHLGPRGLKQFMAWGEQHTEVAQLVARVRALRRPLVLADVRMVQAWLNRESRRESGSGMGGNSR